MLRVYCQLILRTHLRGCFKVPLCRILTPLLFGSLSNGALEHSNP